MGVTQYSMANAARPSTNVHGPVIEPDVCCRWILTHEAVGQIASIVAENDHVHRCSERQRVVDILQQDGAYGFDLSDALRGHHVRL